MLAKIEVELGRPICGDELARDHPLAVTRRTFVEERRGVIQPITPSSNGGQAESSQSIERARGAFGPRCAPGQCLVPALVQIFHTGFEQGKRRPRFHRLS